jgi:hypothetical protein
MLNSKIRTFGDIKGENLKKSGFELEVGSRKSEDRSRELGVGCWITYYRLMPTEDCELSPDSYRGADCRLPIEDCGLTLRQAQGSKLKTEN